VGFRTPQISWMFQISKRGFEMTIYIFLTAHKSVLISIPHFLFLILRKKGDRVMEGLREEGRIVKGEEGGVWEDGNRGMGGGSGGEMEGGSERQGGRT